MNKKLNSIVFLSLFAISGFASARTTFNNGGLGCGTIVSLRESIQRPLPSELADAYGGPKGTGGSVFQVLSGIKGVGFLAAAAAEVVANAGVAAVSSKIEAGEKVKEVETERYRDVKAVEFRFDDGMVINIPVMVVSGMRYKVGVRLNAMVTERYKTFALGNNALFAAAPDIGDSDYNEVCHIDNPILRKDILTSVGNIIKEPLIVNPNERRLTAPSVEAESIPAASGV